MAFVVPVSFTASAFNARMMIGPPLAEQQS